MAKVGEIGPYLILKNRGDETEEEELQGMIDFGFKVMLRTWTLNGHGLDVDTLVMIYFEADRFARATLEDQKSRPVPSDLVSLLQAKKKKEAEKIAGGLTMSMPDFISLKRQAASMGYRHRMLAIEFIPPGLEKLDAPAVMVNAESKTTPEAQRWIKDMGRMFEQRKQQFVHALWNESEHHFFFFDFGDMHDGHWAYGSHVHYSSHLWNIPFEQTFEEFKIKGNRPSNAHISFVALPPGRSPKRSGRYPVNQLLASYMEDHLDRSAEIGTAVVKANNVP